MNISTDYAFLFVLLCSLSVLSELDRNKLKIFGSIKGLNGIANELANSDESSRELGKRVASSFTVVSEWDRALNGLAQLNDVEAELNFNLTRVKEMALNAIIAPTDENVAALENVSLVYRNVHLHRTQLSAMKIIGALKGLHYRLGEFQTAQIIGDPVFQDTDKEFREFRQEMTGIDETAKKLEDSFGNLGKLTENKTETFASDVMKLAFELTRETAEFDKQIKRAQGMVRTKLDTFSWDISDEVNGLYSSVNAIAEDIKAGIGSVLLGQIEADTKPARECYRSLTDVMGTGKRRKDNFGLLLGGPSNVTILENKRERILQHLEDPDRGVDYCLRNLRSIYDPANGPPTNPRDIFYKIRERFLVQFNDPLTWSRPKALGELRSFELMSRQLLLQLSSLLILKYLTLVAGTKSEEINEEGVRTYETFNEGIQVIKKKYFEHFPRCEYTVALDEAVHTKRLLCEVPRFQKNTGQSQKLPSPQPTVGSVCRFECYGKFSARPVVCGPGGQWSRNDSSIEADFLACSRAVFGVTDLRSEMLDGLNNSMTDLKSKMLKADTGLKNSDTNLDKRISALDGLFKNRMTDLKSEILDGFNNSMTDLNRKMLKADTGLKNSGLPAFSVYSEQGHTANDPKFTLTNFNSEGGWDVAKNRLEVKEPGLYHFILTGTRAYKDTLDWVMEGKRGNKVVKKRWLHSLVSGTATHSVSVIWRMEKGDFLTVRQVSGRSYCGIRHTCSLTGFRLQ